MCSKIFGRAASVVLVLASSSLSACSASTESLADTGSSRLNENLSAAPSASPYKLVAVDNLDTKGWWFFKPADGRGRVTMRPDSFSPNRAGDVSAENPVGVGAWLGNSFELDEIPTDCVAQAYVKPLTPVRVKIETFDSATHNTVHSSSFEPEFNAADSTWARFDNAQSEQQNPFTSNSVSVRLILDGTGAPEEALFDDVTVSCY